MTTPTEYWRIDYVQYVPNRETVQLAGAHVIVAPSGRSVQEAQNILTTQADLLAKCPPGVSVWGDEEVAAIVVEHKGMPAQFSSSV